LCAAAGLGTNSAGVVRSSVERLLSALGTEFDEISPGVLLSRSRELEAVRVAFHDELMPDTTAMLASTAHTLRDLLASFPRVRRIEAEALALDLDRNADAVPAIREHMAAIKGVAAKSEAVTVETIGALSINDTAIEEAIDPVVQRRLVADSLLVFGNFVREVVRRVASYGSVALAKARAELGPVAKESWEEIKARLPKSVGETFEMVPKLALVALAVHLIHPVMGSAQSLRPSNRWRKSSRASAVVRNRRKPKGSTRSRNTGNLKGDPA
jgi:hypothetical protein